MYEEIVLFIQLLFKLNMYRGATLDVMVAFSDRPIVFRYQENRGIAFNLFIRPSLTRSSHQSPALDVGLHIGFTVYNDNINSTELGWLRVCPPDVWYRGSLGW